MADEEKPVDLIQRFAEKMLRHDGPQVAERAADRLSEVLADGDLASSGRGAAQDAATALAGAVEDASSRRETAEARRTHNFVEIDLIKLQLAGYLTPASDLVRLAEEFRVVKRPLLLEAFGQDEDKSANRHLIMVTSAGPGEGKTFTAINLAMSMVSECDLYVLLVDTDVHQRDLATTLGIGTGKGLIDLLVDERLDLADVLVRTNVPNLTVLPSGTQHPLATELFASRRMAELMQDIAARYRDRVILIDAPPVLLSSEPGVLALHVGQIVMVVEMGRTSRRALERALPLIGACPGIRFILNRVDFDADSNRFGSYAYYKGYKRQD